MLDMGFIPDIERIFSLTPFTRQTLFFSATMAPEIERITNTFLSAPARIEVARQATASETIAQSVVMFRASSKDRQPSEKRALLRALIDAEGDACTNAIVFCNRKTEVDIVAKSLQKYGYDAAPIHGDLEQSQRTRTLDGFREGTLRFLVASDVAARGLDIPAVSHVFNFDVPSHPEDYVHRIGRTGRAGRSGKAIMICTPHDEKYLEAVERLVARPVPRADAPAFSAPPPGEGEGDSASGDRERGRDRSRGGRDNRRDSRRGAPRTQGSGFEAPAPSIASAAEMAIADAAAPDVALAEAPARAQRPSDPVNARDTRPRRDDRRDDRRDNRRDDLGPPVVGLGDHLPTFIAMSLDERRATGAL
jgi:ATP-dependent RNA helicase RhlE